MKTRILTSLIIGGVLATSVAQAGTASSIRDLDAVSASFVRDLNREMSVRYVPSTVANADPLDVIDATLRSEPDPVLASFERDLYREAVAYKSLPAGTDADPLDAINTALRCDYSVTINASIANSHNRC